jgi:predicted glycosyltransferase involved in capsule biosynthesis
MIIFNFCHLNLSNKFTKFVVMELSLIVPYRNRPQQLTSLLEWYPEAVRRSKASIELILVESSESPSLNKSQLNSSIIYRHIEEIGPFNKSKLLNEGLRLASGKFVSSFDVDLFPFDLTFATHLALAHQSENLLITGYRMFTPFHSFSLNQLNEVQRSASVARENLHEGFLLDQLLNGHRFGQTPFFKKSIVDDLKGWDEKFVGWGGEDQDIIHRYLGKSRHLMISPDLVYLHLKHDYVTDWNDFEMTRKNREYLYQKLNLAPNIIF